MKVRFYLSYDIKITLKSHFCRKNVKFCYYVRSVVMDVITFPEKYKPLVVYRFYCMALFHSQAQRHSTGISGMKNFEPLNVHSVYRPSDLW